MSAYGKGRVFDSLEAARAARGSAVVGAISFDPGAADHLWQPESIQFDTADTAACTPGQASCAQPCTVSLAAQCPAPRDHHERICAVVERIRKGAADKVVIGRAEQLELNTPIDPLDVFARFRASDPARHAYLVDLDTDVLIGSSPETLIARRGSTISAFPLAGTCPRGERDSADDVRRGQQLLGSEKDRAEHAFVTAALYEALAPLCRSLDIPAEPQLVSTPTTWHLGTPITGELRDPETSILDLVARTHPTPAVCGTPASDALAIIRDVEGAGTRGFFGGALGYCTADGDGEFRVTIRGVLLDRTGRQATAWAGGGLTADSNPDTELHETVIKLARARQGMEVPA